MKITIHRGADQIGGCVTEYEYEGWKLFVDFGEQLPGAPVITDPLDIEGLTYGDISKSALLVTHYHGDHIGRIGDLPADLPVYMGMMAKEIAMTQCGYTSLVSETRNSKLERLKIARTFMPGEKFEFGKFSIIPIMVDHSAFDAYAFCIEAGGKKAFHTGDFRTHGFRSGKLQEVIKTRVGEQVDCVVCEATHAADPDEVHQREADLQRDFEQVFRDNKYNVVYVSSTNIDRLFSLYHAAIRAYRPFYVDAYQKKIMDVVAGRDIIYGKSELFQYKSGLEPIVLKRDGSHFKAKKKFNKKLAEKGYVMIARSSERYDDFLTKIPGDGRRVFLSMWKGYVDENNAAYNPALVKSLGEGYEYYHTSGHCDMKSLRELLTLLNPGKVIPIHTDSPQTFSDRFSDSLPVLLIKDGESYRI